MKKILALTAILLALGLVAYIYFQKESPLNSISTLQHAIPSKFPIAIESDDWQGLFEKIDTFNYGESLINQDWIVGTKVNLNYLKSLMDLMPAGANSSKGQKILVAYGNAGNSQLGISIAMESNAQWSYNNFKKFVEDSNLKFEEYDFNNTKLLTIIGFNDIDRATLTFKDGILLFSTQSSFVEESILALDKATIPWEDLSASLEGEEDARLYLKPAELNFLSSYFLKASSFELMNYLSGITGNTVLQLNFFKDELSFSGYAAANKGTLLDTLQTLSATDNDILNSLPANTACYELIAMGNQEDFQTEDLEVKSLYSIIGDALVLFSLESFNENLDSRRAAMVALDKSDVLSDLSSLDATITLSNTLNETAIYSSHLGPLLNRAFFKTTYFQEGIFFCVLNKQLILSANQAVLEQCILAQGDLGTLKANMPYNNFKSSIASKCQVDLYADLSLMQAYLSGVSTENSWQSIINKVNVQFTNIGDQMYCNGKLSFASEGKKVSKSLWTLGLDSTSMLKPQIVRNHNNSDLEVIAQDAANNLYLISASGEILWKKSISGRIMGDVEQLDYYKNKKLQYIFNTTSKIYIVDRNGDFVDGFPIDLPTQASNGLLLVNYDNAGDYRYIVACDNGNVYGYEQNGSPLPGWNPKKDVGIVKDKIQHLVRDDKDYLFFKNTDGLFFALNRKAEDRFKPVKTANYKNDFQFDEQGFVGGDHGMIYEIDMMGAVKSKTILDSSFVHCVAVNSILDNSKAYAFASGSTFKFQQSQWKNLSSFSTDKEIKKIQSFINNNKLWFLLYTTDKVFMIDELGTLHPDFPIQTKAEICIEKLIDGKGKIVLHNDVNGNLSLKEIAW